MKIQKYVDYVALVNDGSDVLVVTVRGKKFGEKIFCVISGLSLNTNTHSDECTQLQDVHLVLKYTCTFDFSILVINRIIEVYMYAIQ